MNPVRPAGGRGATSAAAAVNEQKGKSFLAGSAIRQVGTQAAIYGLGGVLNRLLGFVLLPVYTRFLTPADYGVYALLVITGQIATTFVQLGVGSAIFREVLYRGSDESLVESTALYFLAGEAAILLGLLATVSEPLSTAIFGDAHMSRLLTLTFLTGVLASVDVVAMAYMRIHKKAGLYSLLSVGAFVLGAALSIYFVVVLRRGVEGLIVAGVIAAAIRAAAYVILLLPRLRLTFSFPVLGYMLRFGVPLVPFGLGRLVLNSSDRYFLKAYATTSDIGIYSVGYSIGIVINIFVAAVQLAWPAQMFAIAKTEDAGRTFSQVLTYYLLVLGYMALFLSVLAPEVLTVMAAPRFHGAYHVVPMVALSYVLYGAMYITNTGIELNGKTQYMAPLMIVAALANLVLNLLFIPRFGIMGAAWATLLSFLFLTVTQLVVNLRLLHVPYEYRRIAKLGLVWLGIYVLSTFVHDVSQWLTVSLKFGLLLGYPAALLLAGFFDERELAAALRIMRSGWARLRIAG